MITPQSLARLTAALSVLTAHGWELHEVDQVLRDVPDADVIETIERMCGIALIGQPA